MVTSDRDLVNFFEELSCKSSKYSLRRFHLDNLKLTAGQLMNSFALLRDSLQNEDQTKAKPETSQESLKQSA